MRFTFRKGIHPKECKDLTRDAAFETLPVPDKVYIPLSQHIGAPCTPAVEKGDAVKVGTLIGLANGKVSANVHSSVSGVVEGFEMRVNAQGRKIKHIVIAGDGKDETAFLEPLSDPTPAQIIQRVKDCGIVGMGGATFPTHVKLETGAPIKALIINGSECEPYITTDDRMMRDLTAGVLDGIELIRIALGAPKVLIGIESNKPEAIAAMQAGVRAANTEICALKTKYPQGGEKQLIYALTREKVPNGGLPSDVGYIVLNISTAYAIYEAVRLGKPCYARYMTVSGKGINRPANLYVRIGTPLTDVVAYLGGAKEYSKAVSGGPMMGIGMAGLDSVAAKGTSALLLLQEDEIRAVEPTPCINCARCARVCPIGLMPMMTDALILAGKIEEAKKYYPLSCIECGCCAYVCPAKRPLVQSQRLAKKLIREREAGGQK